MKNGKHNAGFILPMNLPRGTNSTQQTKKHKAHHRANHRH